MYCTGPGRWGRGRAAAAGDWCRRGWTMAGAKLAVARECVAAGDCACRSRCRWDC